MRPLRYSINVTLDGCCDHRAIQPDPDLMHNAIQNIAGADALLFGRTIYQMMESYWRPLATDPTQPFAQAIHAARKYVVSTTLPHVDWNAELLRGDLRNAVQHLKQQPGGYLFTGGLKLPLALAELDLIDEYEFVVHPNIAGHGPTLLAGLTTPLNLRLISRVRFASGAVARRYQPVR